MELFNIKQNFIFKMYFEKKIFDVIFQQALMATPHHSTKGKNVRYKKPSNDCNPPEI